MADKVAAEHSTPANLQVIYEDNHLIAVNKRVGDIVQGDATGDTPLSEVVKEYLKIKYNKPGNVYTGVVHRIDRPVSGVVLFSKTSKALPRLNKLFQTRDAKKCYWAVVQNRPPKDSDTLVQYLYKVEKNNKSYALNKPRDDAKRSELTYRLLDQSNDYFLLEVLPETGRHHQIRVQLAAMGCPIKGDLKYGAPRSNANGGIHLHARELQLIHPVSNEPIRLVAPVPDDNLWKFFEERVG
jgi:23S rRNA pseudouridine1911/1915/1917 synthase